MSNTADSSPSLSSLTGAMKSFNREKYLRILESEGINAAVTQLHKDMWTIEFDCFEGPKGYQPGIFEELKKYRALSIELWDKTRDPKFKP